MTIRPFQPGDAQAIAQLFYDTVHEVNVRDYTQEQVDAWAAEVNADRWLKHCSERMTYVAESEEVIAGYAQLEANGHIDCFYCHKDFIGKGVGRKLYERLEERALELGVARLFVEASITAKAFFERMGCVLVREQSLVTRGVAMKNNVMEKVLA